MIRHSLAPSPTLQFILRTFHGRAAEIGRKLLPALTMFAEPHLPLRVVLDDDSEDDHRYGDCLSASSDKLGRNISVAYAKSAFPAWRGAGPY